MIGIDVVYVYRFTRISFVRAREADEGMNGLLAGDRVTKPRFAKISLKWERGRGRLIARDCPGFYFISGRLFRRMVSSLDFLPFSFFFIVF